MANVGSRVPTYVFPAGRSYPSLLRDGFLETRASLLRWARVQGHAGLLQWASAQEQALRKITKLSNVPSSKIPAFQAMINGALESTYGYDESRTSRKPGMRSEVKRVARCARALSAVLEDLSPGAYRLLSAARPHDGSPTILDFSDAIVGFIQIADHAVEITDRKRVTKKRGRREGFVPHLEFSTFVHRLMNAAKECGGPHLTFGRKGRPDTLVDALEALRPILPANFIPERYMEMLPRLVRDHDAKSKKIQKNRI